MKLGTINKNNILGKIPRAFFIFLNLNLKNLYTCIYFFEKKIRKFKLV